MPVRSYATKPFSTVQPRRERELDDILSQRIALSGGRILTDRYWGQYIAAYKSGDDDGVYIQRDPLEMAPCYYFQADGLWLIVSDISVPRRLGLQQGGLDWSAVGQLLLRPDLRTEETCILGICEMPGGCRLKINGRNTAVERLWHPSRFVAAAEGLDSRAILETLRRTAQNCIHAWASCYDRMLVQISGGLDSSILAATLAGRGEALTAVTLATSQPEGDERVYSRRVAEHLAIPLLELAYDPSRVDVREAGSAHLPRPTARSHVQETDRLTLHAAHETHSEVVFNGNGGDAVFGLLQSVGPVVDRLLMEGLGAGALRTAFDVSRLTGVGILTVLRRSVRRALRRRQPYRWRTDKRFLVPSLVDSLSHYAEHPWLDTDALRLPGKAGQIAGIAQSHYHREGFASGGAIHMISPLLSQPLVELCLSIPTWMCCEGGVNRSLARDAFRKGLPDDIVQRQSKGGPDGLLVAILERNRELLSELLCGGLLASNQIIDADAVFHELRRRGPTAGDTYIRLLDLADVEVWARAQIG